MSTEQEREDRIKRAKARLEAAKLRVLAVQQDDVSGYERTAARISSGQDLDYPDGGRAESCLHKAALSQSLAAQTRARADLIEAEAGIGGEEATHA